METDTTKFEEIRALIASYAHGVDDGRTEDVLTLWESDGAFELVGMGVFSGETQLRDFYNGPGAPAGPQVHLVSNILITPSGEDDAVVASDFLLAKRDEDWRVTGRGRYHDAVRRGEDGWRFVRRSVNFE